MDGSIALAIIITAINVIGWIYTKVFGIGKLQQKVDSHDKILNNGLIKELQEVKEQCAKLRGTVETYIKIREGGRK